MFGEFKKNQEGAGKAEIKTDKGGTGEGERKSKKKSEVIIIEEGGGVSESEIEKKEMASTLKQREETIT